MAQPQVPLTGGDSTKFDRDALERLDANDAQRLTTVRARAQKWIAGLTGLTGLLGTVLVIKGPDSATALPLGWRVAVAGLIAVALGLLAAATICAYRSANGDPGELEEVERNPLAGLHERLATKQREVADVVQSQLQTAVRLTLVGVMALVLATGVTWFLPTGAGGGSESICVFVNGEAVVELVGESASVTAVNDGATIGSCP